MASRSATVVGFVVLQGPDDAYGGETTGALKRGVLYVRNDTANTVIGGTDTLDVTGIGAVIAGQLRNGKTCTVRSRALYQPAVVGGTSYAGTIAGTTDLTIAPLAVSDYSSNATLPANTSTTQRPYGVFVTWSEA